MSTSPRNPAHDRMVRSLVACALFSVASVLAGCSAGQTPAETTPAASAPRTNPETAAPQLTTSEFVTAESLPTEVGTMWTIARDAAKAGVPLSFDIKGPWVIELGKGARSARNEVVDPATVPQIERFDGYEYVVKSSDGTTDEYRVHGLTEEWVTLLGSVAPVEGTVKASVERAPLNFWPLDFRVGDRLLVSEDDAARVEATVLARNTARVPAGTIDGAYLVRFDHIRLNDDPVPPASYYYLLSPDVGFVALIVPRTGNEATGFVSANYIEVLQTLPSRP